MKNCGCENQLSNQLSNVMFDELWAIIKIVTGEYDVDYMEAIYEIYEAVNYNEKQKLGWYDYEVLPFDMFVLIFNTYYYCILNHSELNQYDDTKGDDYNSLTIKCVSTASGVKTDIIKRALRQMYWYIKQGKVKSNKWLYPREWEEYKEFRNVREDGKGNEWFADTISTLKTLGIIAGIGLVAYIGFVVYGEYKSVKRAANNE